MATSKGKSVSAKSKASGPTVGTAKGKIGMPPSLKGKTKDCKKGCK